MTNLHTRFADSLTDAEKERLFGWGKDIFGDEVYAIQWRPKTSHMLLYADDQLVSHVGFVAQTVTVADQDFTVAGIGSVATAKEAQGHGYAATAMRQAIPYMRDQLNVDFGYLFCFNRLRPFYARLGWQHLTDTVMVEQSETTLPVHDRLPTINSMIHPCQKSEWPQGTVYLNSAPW